MKIIVILLIIIGLFFTYKYLSPTANGKEYVEDIILKSNNNGSNCSWAGFVLHKKTKLLQIFLPCDIASSLEKSTINSKEELTQSIHNKVIKPLLEAFPENNNVMVTFIAQVKEDVVLCVDIKKKKIINSVYDSYENYCWPQ